MLSEYERYAKICLCVSRMINLARANNGILQREYPNLCHYVEDLWPAVLNGERRNELWPAGGQLNVCTFRNASPVTVALREAATVGTTESETETSFDRCIAAVRIPTLLIDKPLQRTLVDMENAVEELAYAIRRYDDAFLERYEHLNSVTSRIQGELVTCLSDTPYILQAYLVHHLCEKALGMVEHDNDFIVESWVRYGWAAKVRVSESQDIHWLASSWKEFQDKALNMDQRVQLSILLVGANLGNDGASFLDTVVAYNEKASADDKVSIDSLSLSMYRCSELHRHWMDIQAKRHLSVKGHCLLSDAL